MIPYGKQDINEDDIAEVIKVLKSDFITQGPVVPLFEKKLASYANSEYCYALNSATSALHTACLAIDLGPGDILWTSPISFVASSNAALYCGATVDFVDIDAKTYNMSISALKNKLEHARDNKLLPKVVMPVHLSGQSCDMEKIYDLSLEYGFKIIEDASHAIGGRYKNKPIGSCEFSDMSIFSFHPVKIITTGEGGAILTNNKKYSEKIQMFRSHGITRDKALMNQEPHGFWYYQQIELGYNYRMTDIQAALGLSQLQRLDKFINKRHKIANFYSRKLDSKNLVLPHCLQASFSSFHLYIIKLKIPGKRKELMESLKKNGIAANIHYIPIHMQPYYQALGFQKGYLPNSEKYYEDALSIPIYPTLDHKQQDEVVNTINRSIESL